jgi:hypothetical protein
LEENNENSNDQLKIKNEMCFIAMGPETADIVSVAHLSTLPLSHNLLEKKR